MKDLSLADKSSATLGPPDALAGRAIVLEQTLAGRFRILSELGGGGMGRVYRAHDAVLRQEVALKMLPHLDATAVVRFKNEFRAVHDLQHPNLALLHELREDGGLWFFTMELVEGVDLLTYLDAHARAGHEPPCDEARLRKVLPQIALALAHLHAAGMVHRDVKPLNILVTAEGRAVLLDFGLVTRADLESDTAGTPKYMAPEQLAGGVIGPPADWYALGVIAFRALTGAMPFTGTDYNVLASKTLDRAPTVRSVRSSAPDDLAALVDRLLEREPERRPTGVAVLRALGSDAATVGPPSTRFVGRTAELARLRDAWDATRADGVGRTAALVGMSGIGKSAAIDVFLRRLSARTPNLIVLRGRCFERESVPFKGLDGVLDALGRQLRSLPEATTRAIWPPDGPLLSDWFPTLAPGFDQASAPPIDPRERLDRSIAALRSLVVGLAREHPVLVVIDDFHWAPPDTVSLLEQLLQPPNGPALLTLLAARPCGRDLLPGGLVTHVVELGPLPIEDAATLATGLGAARAREVACRGEGHPMFVLELLRPGALGASTLEEALARRVEHLPPPALHVLEALAVAGRPLRHWQCAALTHVQMAELAAVVASLRQENLVRTDGPAPNDPVDLFHDHVRGAVLTRIADTELPRRHLAIAEALLLDPTEPAESIARHLHAAGDVVRACEYYERAATDARTALAFERAVALLEAALSLVEAGTTHHARLAAALGDAAVEAGLGRRAADAYLLAADAEARPEEADRLRSRAAEQLLSAGHVDDGLVLLGTVTKRAGLSLPASALSTVPALLIERSRLKLSGLRWRERPPAERDAALLRRIDVCDGVATSLGIVDHTRAALFQARALRLSLLAGEPGRMARSLAHEVAYRSVPGGEDDSSARTCSEAARELVEAIGDPALEALLLACRGVGAYLRGWWRDAAQLLANAETLFRERCRGVWWERATVQLFELAALGYLGRLDRLRSLLPARIRSATERGDLFAQANLRTRIQHLVSLADDAPASARADADAASAMWSRGGYYIQHYYVLVARAHADLYEGDGEGALAKLRSDWPLLRRSLQLHVQETRLELLFLRARAHLLSAEAGVHGALERASRDAKRMRRERMRWSDPLADLIVAGVTRRAGDDARAATQFDGAAEELTAQGVFLHAAAARVRSAELRGEAESTGHAFLAGIGIRDLGRMLRLLAP